MPRDLLSRVRHALTQAGFQLVEEGETSRPGLSVTSVPAGVLVRWTASDGFTSLAKDQPGVSGDSIQVIVQAAVTGILVQLGHTIAEPPDGQDLLVLADES